MKPSASDRGFILIVVLAILAVLALLGITFVSLQAVEKDISQNYLDATRANFAASSGVEVALTKLRYALNSPAGPFMATPLGRAMVYFGNQLDETLNPSPSTSIKSALNPSYAIEINGSDITDNAADLPAYDPTPKQIRIDGTDVGYSGALESGTYGRECDIYSLKITDANGKIYVNDGLGHAANTARLRIILNNLGALATVNVPNLGDTIINNRPSAGYASHHDLRKLFPDTATFDRVRNFICAYAWVDNKVVNPVPLSPSVLGDYPIPFTRPEVPAGSTKPPSYPATWGEKIYRYGRQVNFRNVANTTAITWGSNIYGWDELNPQYIEVTSRAPVNINVAPREVLIALLRDLEGFFVMETPRDNYPNLYGYYNFLMSVHGFDDSSVSLNSRGYYPTQPSMIGTMYKTVKISAALAATIADKIIANRSKRLGTGDITLPYHGPFTSWAQFNLFANSMVTDGTLVDTRFAGLQRTHASQAIADMLKANFNPNLHLNEINPDENLYTHVDKTDMIYNTTEFCFAYRGIFEIESLGRILKPIGSTTEYRTVAEKTIQCAVKLYDVYREGTQRDFHRGEATIDDAGGPLTEAAPHANYRTNNNRSLETGPESDNGLAPSENEYEGYVRLSTIGGDLPVPATSTSAVAGVTLKPKDTVWETPRGAQLFGASMVAHFTYDFDLSYAIAAADPTYDVRRRTLTRNWNQGRASISGMPLTYYNFADWSEKNSDGTEKVAGPYALSDSSGITLWAAGVPGLREYRVARSFRLAPGTGLAPSGRFFAPSDVRMDGAYSERHAAPVYWPGSAGTWQSNADSNIYTRTGAVSMWIKPGFHPELAGKLRSFFSQSKLWYTSSRDHLCSATDIYWCNATFGRTILCFNPNPMSSFFVPNNIGGIDNGTGTEGNSAFTAQRSLAYAFCYSTWTGGGGFWQQGAYTNTTNHVNHGDDSRINNKLKAHRWTHLTVRWVNSTAQSILINGQTWGPKLSTANPTTPLSVAAGQDWNRHGAGGVWNAVNPVRLGEPSILVPPANASTPGGFNANLNCRYQNFAADSTLDELYVWPDPDNAASATHAQQQWKYGRYYRNSDGRFTSGDIDLRAYLASRNLPAAIPLSPDPEIIPDPAPPVPQLSRPRLIGVSWTQVAEDYVFGTTADPLRYRLYDYQPWNTNAAANPTPLNPPQLEVKISGDGGNNWSPVVTDSRWCPMNVPVTQADRVKYSVKFITNPDPMNNVLLASPVLDDVLLFVEMSETYFLEYVVL